MVNKIQLLFGKIIASVSGSGTRAPVKYSSGVERMSDVTNNVYTRPTMTIEYVSARGTLRCGFWTILNKDAAHSKPKKAKNNHTRCLEHIGKTIGGKRNQVGKIRFG